MDWVKMTSSPDASLINIQLANADAPPIDRQGLMFILTVDLAQARETQSLTALLLVDLANFRQINQRYGYTVGDSLLARVSALLLDNIKKASAVYRVGDDVFAVVVPNMQSRQQLPVAAGKIQRLLAEPVDLQKDTIRLQCHVGVSVAPEDANMAGTLLSHAENSLARARKTNDKYFVAERSSNDESIIDEWKLREELSDAIRDGKLNLQYQPKVCLRRFIPVACETLIRWTSPTSGPISPEIFIPIAERTGLITDITEWVIMSLPREAKEMKFREQALNISINLSPIDLSSENLSVTLQSALNIWGLPSSNITLEITESAMMDSPEQSFELMEALKAQGFRISIDDFGTGYSSMSYFKLIPADEIKIDKCFITNLQHDKGDQAIVRAIIAIAHDFGMTTVAEGIEDAATVQLLSSMGCDYAQGYHFSKPLPAPDFVEWLEGYKMWNYLEAPSK